MSCYVTGAALASKDLKRVVFVFSDVYGYDTGNHILFADVLADRLDATKTAVLMPDLFRGNPIAQPLFPSFLPDSLGMLATLPAFLYRIRFNHPPIKVERDLTEQILPWLRKQVPNLAQIGTSCLGFCFGGWVVARSLALEELNLKCGVGVHPSFIVESKVHRGDEAELVMRIGRKPVLLLPAGNDSKEIKVGGQHTKALAKARNVPEDAIALESPGMKMKHGWVSRGDGTDPTVSKCQEDAMVAIVNFLEQNH